MSVPQYSSKNLLKPKFSATIFFANQPTDAIKTKKKMFLAEMLYTEHLQTLC